MFCIETPSEPVEEVAQSSLTQGDVRYERFKSAFGEAGHPSRDQSEREELPVRKSVDESKTELFKA